MKHILSIIVRWIGPLLILASIVRLWFIPSSPYPLAAILPSVGAVLTVAALLSTRSPEHRNSRIVLATILLGGLALHGWRYSDQARAYRQISVSFDNRGARLAGTLYLPNRPGRHPGIVSVHGSEGLPRVFYGLFGDHYARAGFAFLTYDKRGVGASTGTFERDCNTCPANIELLASDASAALSLLAAWPDVRPDNVGFVGGSQAGWIVPRAAVLNGRAAFMVLISAPTTTVHQNMRYERFTKGGKDPGDSLTPNEADALADRVPQTFTFPDTDPLEDLRVLNIPGLWLYGDHDWLVPPGKSMRNLDALIKAGKPYTYRLIPGARHSDYPGPNGLVQRTIDAWLARVVG